MAMLATCILTYHSPRWMSNTKLDNFPQQVFKSSEKLEFGGLGVKYGTRHKKQEYEVLICNFLQKIDYDRNVIFLAHQKPIVFTVFNFPSNVGKEKVPEVFYSRQSPLPNLGADLEQSYFIFNFSVVLWGEGSLMLPRTLIRVQCQQIERQARIFAFVSYCL